MSSDDRILPLRPIIFFSVVYSFITIPFYTAYNIQELVADSVSDDYKQAWNGFKWNGYISLGTLNWTNVIFSWFTPPLISLINSKRALGLGAIGFNLALVTFLFPCKYGLHIATAILGISTSIMWSSQGSYLSYISNHASANRDTGISWLTMESGAALGNVFVTYLIQEKEHILANTRTLIYSSLIVFGIIGIILTFFLETPIEEEKSEPVLKELGQSIKLLATKRMALLCITFFYSGLESSFFNTLYCTTVGYTKAFGVNRKQYADEAGMLIGVGEVVAGLLLIVTRRVDKSECILTFTYVLSILTFGSIYINFPNNASSIETDEPAIIHPSLILAFICAFALGFADGCIETQIYRFIITYYPHNATAPFAILTSIQALSMGVMYILSTSFGLHFHCIFLSITCTIGIAAFFLSYAVKEAKMIAGDPEEARAFSEVKFNCDIEN